MRRHAILLRNLVTGCPATDMFGNRGRTWLQHMPLPAEEREALDSNLRSSTSSVKSWWSRTAPVPRRRPAATTSAV